MAKNWALVIGINGYNPLNFAPLKYAKRDAETVKAFFEDAKFDEVCCFTDDSPPLVLPNGLEIPTLPTYGNLVSFFEDRFKKPFLSTGDNCWFFFAGHGERHADKDYLMPMDANARGSKVISGLLVDEVREWLTRSGADNVILLLDACRSQGSRGARGIDPTEQQGVITISSCNPTQKSWEVEELQQGVFTHALLESMQLTGERSCATVERLGNYLKHRVPELCQRYGKAPAQVPRISVDPIEKQHFILIPQCARQADIDLMKYEGYRLMAEDKLQLAEQMFLRVNVAARGLDPQALDALMRVRIRIRETPIVSTPSSTETATARSGIEMAATFSIADVAESTFIDSSESPVEAGLDDNLSSSAKSTAKPAPTPPPTPNPPTESEDDVPLESERGIDYHELQDLLSAGNWEAADQETAKQMLEAMGKDSWWEVEREDLLNFPCKDLKTIDRLWVKYSGGQFGFSVQKEIYLECGGVLDGQYHEKAFEKFGDRVGWRDNRKWVFNVTYSTSSPKGHLPRWLKLKLRWLVVSALHATHFSSLASQLVNCSR
ncbi:MAG: hypothetical protein HC833_15220 [Leptolyngbyaceae cyanobacterium RM1_406_9]|nr:hypothetical protein [Leptolyngbyaceae cyanobacterium RM1_406_9]